jgi:arginyl-tRNA synthetase
VIQERLAQTIREAATAAAPDLALVPEDIPEPELDRPKVKEHGDWSTNLAMVLAKPARKPPRVVAEAVADRLRASGIAERVDVAGPGFINLFLGAGWLRDVLREILERGPEYGCKEPTGRRVQVEFVSANPVGPLHVGTARNAALGDSVASVLEAAGYEVEREYYFNDAGRQLDLYGESVEARYFELFGEHRDIPEDGYHGQHVIEIAQAIAGDLGDSLRSLPPDERRTRLRDEAVARNISGIRRTLERFGIRFDSWTNERELQESGAVADAVRRLRDAGYAYEDGGAVYFRAAEFGDDKDRVLIRSNGAPTYFAVDCAYVLRKAGKGFDRLIYVWGADHHGTVKRLQGAAQVLGVKQEVEILLYQLITLYRGGEQVKMSKRSGDYVTLDELLDDVGVDAARYTLVARSPDSAMDFDIEVVARETLENPVYYVQYAHARIASILRVAVERRVTSGEWRDANLDRISEEAELDLLRKLAEFPEVVDLAAQGLAPHRLTHHAEELAAAFHRFYRDCRVVSDDEELTRARLWLSVGAKQVLASALGLIGVSAPASMERIYDEDRGAGG